MSPVFGAISIIALFIAILFVVYCRIRIRILRQKLKEERNQNATIGSFLGTFSENVKRMDFSNVNDLVNSTARYVADLIQAQSVCIFTRDGDELCVSGIFGAFPPLQEANSYVMTKQKYILERVKKQRIKLGENIVGDVALTLCPLLISDPQDPRIANRDIPINTLMAVPMTFSGNCVGVVCAVDNRRDPDAPFDAEQFTRLKFISAQIVFALNIQNAYAQMSKQQRLMQELEFARNLQSSLLPKSFPAWGDFKIHAFTRASKEVSGDFYDFVELDNDRMLVVVGDACGKGIPACMIMAMTRSFIRANINRFTNLKDLLEEVNDNLFRDTGDGQYITIGACLLNRKESTLEYTRAGHTELLIYVRNHIRTIKPDGAALGLLPSELADFDTFCIEFTPDMEILLFTDGINEAVSPLGEQYNVDRIKDNFMRSASAREMPSESIKRLMNELDEFTLQTEQADDQTVVIIRHL